MDSNGRASRIDHCFMNKEWIHQDFSNSVHFLNPHISDHCPLLVSLSRFLLLVVDCFGTSIIFLIILNFLFGSASLVFYL